MNAFERLRELRDVAAFPAWLCAAARNAGVESLRRRRSRADVDAAAEVADAAHPPDVAAAHKDAAARALAVIATLPAAYRETLVRFDTVYYQHFKVNRRRIVDYPNLWGYMRDLYQQPGVAETVDMEQIKIHYFTTHEMINPSRLIPVGPELDFLAPHDRAP